MNLSHLLNNPALNSVSPDKLNFLLQFAQENHDKKPKDMVPLFMAASASARKKGMTFSGTEFSLILEILKQNMSDEEKKKTDMIINMFQTKRDTP